MSNSFSYLLGSIFPTTAEGNPNILLSSSLAYNSASKTIQSNNDNLQDLEIDLNITSNPVQLTNVDKFVRDYLLGPNGLTTIYDEDGTLATNSFFNKYQSIVASQWENTPRNNSIYNLLLIGYEGAGADQARNNDAFWSANGDKDDALLKEIQDLNNYAPLGKWGKYQGSEQVHSNFDRKHLLDNLNAEEGETPPLWLPNFLYTYGIANENGGIKTSYPGPTLIMQPGENLTINFENEIFIPGLTLEQMQQATTVPNSSYGNGASGGLGANSSTNFHFHGAHTDPTGFGDNVVSRYTTGQNWTTNINIPEDHGIGSYWYHPHYHPSVNTQVYGGLSGFIQLGDPLARIPGLEDIPRNLAILKNIDLDFGSNDTPIL